MAPLLAKLAVKIVNLVPCCRSAALCATINMSTDINVFYLYFTRISLPISLLKKVARKEARKIILYTCTRVENRNITKYKTQ